MRKKVITVKTTDTVEYAVAKAQSTKIGTLIVVDKNKILGICTTNDFFYRIVNPVLGLGESGIRIVVPGAGNGKSLEQIFSAINKRKIGIKTLWMPISPETKQQDIIIHLDTEDASDIIADLEKLGYKANIRPR